MVVNKQVNFIKCLSILLSNISSSILDKFTKFYMKRIFDTDLAPSKTFSYPFTLGHNGQAGHKRSLEKLKGLFIKYLSKVNPAIQLATTDFLPMNRNMGTLILNLFNVRYEQIMPTYSVKDIDKLRAKHGFSAGSFVLDKSILRRNPTEEDAYFRSLTEVRGLFRYARYLNYLARKHQVPIQVSVTRDSAWEGELPDISGKAQVKFNLDFIEWVCRTTVASRTYTTLLESGNSDDAFYSDVSQWVSTNLNVDGSGTRVSTFHVSKFFLHLDKVLTSLNTLTRKVEYGYSAFTFRT